MPSLSPPLRAPASPPLQDDRLFDVSFVSRCFQRGALRRVQGAVIGGNKLIGVCHMSSAQLRALGSSTVPADLKLRDPKCVCIGIMSATYMVLVLTVCDLDGTEKIRGTLVRAAGSVRRPPSSYAHKLTIFTNILLRVETLEQYCLRGAGGGR